ncbi:hypothetical protein [Pseudomonas luteola]|uniref:hypothetical protein n=1 Tax=Pseudomonas luteola TaxID=47886 RepID=UPI0015E36683|nr:hypothetical protein [Pseudomonas zeshuii]MBA1250709.1 hypothetical protein [Pseudomonas zeshuii]
MRLKQLTDGHKLYMNKNMVSYIAWYKKERDVFCNENYLNKKTWINKKILPYSNWDSEEVFIKETNFVLNALIEIEKRKIDKRTLSLAIVALSNRSEYINDQADFHTTYAGFLIFGMTVSGIIMPIFIELLVVSIFSVVVYVLLKRLKLRREIAVYKELVSILKQFESKHG